MDGKDTKSCVQICDSCDVYCVVYVTGEGARFLGESHIVFRSLVTSF